MTDSTPSAELLELAFRYVADELTDGNITDGEREAFEIRLATDQEAREAVALAVEIIAACGKSPDRPQPFTQTRARRRVGTAGRTVAAGFIAVAAAVALVAVVRFWTTPPANIDSPNDVPTGSLVSVWGSLGESGEEGAVDDPIAALAIIAGADTVDALEHNGAATDGAVSDVAATDEIAAPDWLLAALADEAMTPDDESDDG